MIIKDNWYFDNKKIYAIYYKHTNTLYYNLNYDVNNKTKIILFK